MRNEPSPGTVAIVLTIACCMAGMASSCLMVSTPPRRCHTDPCWRIDRGGKGRSVAWFRWLGFLRLVLLLVVLMLWYGLQGKTTQTGPTIW